MRRRAFFILAIPAVLSALSGPARAADFSPPDSESTSGPPEPPTAPAQAADPNAPGPGPTSGPPPPPTAPPPAAAPNAPGSGSTSGPVLPPQPSMFRKFDKFTNPPAYLPDPSNCNWDTARRNREATKRFASWTITASLIVAQLSLTATAMSGIGYLSALDRDAPGLKDRAGLVFKYSIPITAAAWVWYAIEWTGKITREDELKVRGFDLSLARCPPKFAGWR